MLPVKGNEEKYDKPGSGKWLLIVHPFLCKKGDFGGTFAFFVLLETPVKVCNCHYNKQLLSFK